MMINLTQFTQPLDHFTASSHSDATCGQSRGGGVVTSFCRRRSRFLGRVVVAHVQGSPKGGDALGLLGVTNTRLWPVPPLNKGGMLMRRIFRMLLCSLPLAGMGSTPSAAQGYPDPWGGITTNSKLAAQMKGVCSNPTIATAYASYMLGYHVFDTGGGERISIEKNNALAEEILSRASITEWTFAGWSGGSTEGRCIMNLSLTLAPQDAAHFDNDPQWGGDVSVALRQEAGGWRIISFDDAGATDAVSGWLAVWRKERDAQPGGSPRLAPPLSAQELDLKASFARVCATHWQISDDLFPAYNAWLEVLGKPVLLKFKVGSSGRLDAGRLVSSNGQAIVCRYSIGTGLAGGGVDRSIHDLDMRFTVSGNRVKWEVVSFPNAPASTFTPAQLKQLMSQIYVDGRQLSSAGDGIDGPGNRAATTGRNTTLAGAKR